MRAKARIKDSGNIGNVLDPSKIVASFEGLKVWLTKVFLI